VWQYQPGVKLKQQVTGLKKIYKAKPQYNPHSPLNYFSENLVFEESSAKKVGEVLADFLE